MEELHPNPEVQTVEVFAPHHYHPEPHAGLDPDQEMDELDEQIKTKIYVDDPFKINSQLIFSMTDEELDPDVVRQNASKKMETVYRPKKWAVSKLNKVKKSFGLNELVTALPDTYKVNDNLITMDIKTADDKTTNMEFSFFTEGIFKMKCINPANPSKFSFEMVEKPFNLEPLNIGNFVAKQDDQFEVTLQEAQMKIQVKFDPFNISIFSTKDSSNDLLFEMNTSKSLKFDDNLTADFKFTTPFIYGLPERAHNLLLLDSREDLPYRLYNNDLFGYECDSRQALYGSIPMVVARKQNSPTYTTLFWENTSETYIDVHKEGDNSKTFWLSERGNLELYVFVNHTVQSHYASLARVTGFAAMPQYFTMGYHQCRYSYNDEQDVLHVNEKFNEHEIPCDSITLDIDHTNGFRYFTFDQAMFPDPKHLQDMLDKDGRKLICIADPHIRACDDYKVYKGVIEKNLGVQKPDGTVFKGVCFPGDCVWMDFLNEEARDFWGSQYSYENYTHSTPNLFAWNDMNEPSVFELKDKAMPKDNLHTVKNNDEPEKAIQVQHREVHNIYGYCMHKSTYLGLLRRNKDQNIRPHVLSRAFYAGSQKWSTIWTGDTISTWDHLKYTVPMMLSMALCGISFIGGDVGGFLGNPEPELNVRWNQLGSFMPFFRAHCDKRFERREPWLSSKETYHIIKDMIKKKYKFLPFWYTCFEEHCRTGIPVIRPAWFNEGAVKDASLFNPFSVRCSRKGSFSKYETYFEGEKSQFGSLERRSERVKEETRFMVGDSLLVVPIFVSGQRSIKGFLDGLEGRWYDWFTKKEVFAQDEIHTGLERIGVFMKGGYAIPHFHITPNVKSSRDAKEGDIVLAIGLDQENNAKGRMYFDDGESFDFRKGAYTNKLIAFNKDTFTWSDEDGKFGFEMKNQVTKIFLMGVPEGKIKEGHLTTQDGKKQECHVSYLDDHYVITFSIPAKNDFKIVFE